ncbi:hypothetical protein JCM3770_001326, partial [Rhodotorula araucariae]
MADPPPSRYGDPTLRPVDPQATSPTPQAVSTTPQTTTASSSKNTPALPHAPPLPIAKTQRSVSSFFSALGTAGNATGASSPFAVVAPKKKRAYRKQDKTPVPAAGQLSAFLPPKRSQTDPALSTTAPKAAAPIWPKAKDKPVPAAKAKLKQSTLTVATQPTNTPASSRPTSIPKLSSSTAPRKKADVSLLQHKTPTSTHPPAPVPPAPVAGVHVPPFDPTPGARTEGRGNCGPVAIAERFVRVGPGRRFASVQAAADELRCSSARYLTEG